MNDFYINEISQILEVAEQQQGSEIFLSLKMVMFDTEVNLNGCQYTKEFVEEIAENKDGKYTCLPLVADVEMLASGKYNKLTHLQDKKTGDFKTTQIGSFYKFETNTTDEGVVQLIGYARVPRRHKKVCAALLKLHKDGKLKFSYEIAVANYTVINGVKHIDIDENNFIIGLAVVSMPACVSSTSLLAASLENNLDIIEGEKMFQIIDDKAVGYLSAELDSQQIITKISKLLPSFLEGKLKGFDDEQHRNWDIHVKYIFNEYVVIYDYHTGDYYKITFKNGNNEIELLSLEKVVLEFIVAEIEKINKEANQVNIAELNAKIAELEGIVAEKDVTIAEKENLIAEKDAQIVAVGEQLTVSQAEVEALKPFKAQVEAIEVEKAELEKKEKCTALKEKATKVLDESEMIELAEAFEQLDEVKVNAKIAEKYVTLAEVAKNKKQDNLFASKRITDSNKLDESGSIFERE